MFIYYALLQIQLSTEIEITILGRYPENDIKNRPRIQCCTRPSEKPDVWVGGLEIGLVSHQVRSASHWMLVADSDM